MTDRERELTKRLSSLWRKWSRARSAWATCSRDLENLPYGAQACEAVDRVITAVGCEIDEVTAELFDDELDLWVVADHATHKLATDVVFKTEEYARNWANLSDAPGDLVVFQCKELQ